MSNRQPQPPASPRRLRLPTFYSVAVSREGNILPEHTSQLDFAPVILTCPELVKGETYTVTVGTDSGQRHAE